jgi:DNA-binding transcriptional LysR family regulator
VDAHDRADGLRFDDVVTFLTVHRARSISAAARNLQVTPSQVSKAVARIEAFIGVQLMTRSAKGVSVSLAGLRAIQQLEEIERSVRQLRQTQPDVPVIRLAAQSSMMPTLVSVLAPAISGVRLECLELDLVRTRALASEDVYDVAILPDERPLGEAYSHERIGETESCLLASPACARALGQQPIPVERLDGVPFVMPALLADTRVTKGNDLCPMPFERRTHGHAASTFGAALELAARTEHVVFGPRVAARPWLNRGELIEVQVDGWQVRWALALECHTTRVQAKHARAIRLTLERWLAREG